MKPGFQTLLLIAFIPCTLLAAEPVRLIFDTDITGDVDDVLALAMIHTLADRGKCELLAVTISKQNPQAAPFVDAVNTFYGRPDIPIGVSTTAPFRDSKYLQLADQRDGGKLRYPRDIGISKKPEDTVSLLRSTLEKSPDHSVSIVQVGLAINIADLLQSEGGVDLIRRKVKLLSVMAGAFESVNDNNHYLEANVRNHVESMQTLTAKWPAAVPVVWSGFTIGIAAPYPRASIAEDFNYLDHHIVKEAYLLHSGPNHDRPTWDLSSVLYAVFPARGYFHFSRKGKVTVAADGFTRFATQKKGRDRYLKMTPAQTARVTGVLVQLVSQAPDN